MASLDAFNYVAPQNVSPRANPRAPGCQPVSARATLLALVSAARYALLALWRATRSVSV